MQKKNVWLFVKKKGNLLILLKTKIGEDSRDPGILLAFPVE